MPIYEYRCGACGHELEVMQKMSDKPLVECPSCGKPALSKLVSAAGFQLKGSGWYVTDFRDGKKAKQGDKAKDEKSAGEATVSQGADSGKAGSSEGTDGKSKDGKADGGATSSSSSQT